MNLELLIEAERRGILPADKAAALAEARKRGLVEPAAAQPEQPKERTWRDAIVDNVVGRDDGVMSYGEQLGTALNVGGESLTMGYVGDEAAASADAAIGRGNYDDRLEKYRSDEATLAEVNPGGYAAYALAPAALPGVGMGKLITKAPGLLGKMATGGVLGGLSGLSFGFMEGEGGFENRRDSAVKGATLGGAIGAAAPGVARIADQLSRTAQRSAAKTGIIKSAPSNESLRSLSEQAYSRADAAAPIPRTALADAAEGIADSARAAGGSPKLTPRSQAVLDELMDTANLNKGQNVGFREIETLRRQAQAPAGMLTDKQEMAVGSTIINKIDEFMDSAPAIGPEAKEARSLWARMRQSEMLDDAMEKASRAASGFENGIRNEFRTILNSKSRSRGLTPEVRAAMEEVVKGTAAGNTLRRVGRMMSMGLGQQTNMLGAGLSGAAGAGIGMATGIPGGGMVGAALPAILGALAQKGATATTTKGAELASALARSGGKVPEVNPQIGRIIQSLLSGEAGATSGMLAGPR